MQHASLPASLGIHGELTVSAVDTGWLQAHRGDTAALLDPPASVVRAQDHGDNVMTTAGLSAIAAAMVYSGIQDQAASLGVTSPTFLTPLYGACGSGAGVADISDVALFDELGRVSVGAGAFTPGAGGISPVCAWLFFFAPPVSSWTITEAGVFAAATSAADSGTLVDHYVLSTPVTVESPDSVLLQVALSVAGS